MNQIERISTICEELSEELAAAVQTLRTAERDLAAAFPFTWGVVAAPVLAALESLERAQRLVGPFEPEHLPTIEDEQAAADDDWIKLRQGEA